MRISTGRSRTDTKWKTVDISWQELCEKLSKTTRTRETMNEYKKMSKGEKASVKDVGGFVGGVVEGGRRVKGSVETRSLVTLDADYAEENFWENITALNDYAMCCYSTHSHQAKAPRLRLVIPLDREVTAEEYEPIARKLAGEFGIDQFDTTTYQVTRLMFWPSTTIDGDFYFQKQDGPFLNADSVLSKYQDWRDVITWPLGTREQEVRLKDLRVQGDPLTKPGLVGLFNRAYTVPEAIEKFIPDAYESCDNGRYTYLGGSTYGGAVLYSNEMFLYSHHESDPSSGILCNAFDLIRLHKFADLDGDVDRGKTPVNKLPSQLAMLKFASEDRTVKELLLYEKQQEVEIDFGKGTDDAEWIDELKLIPKTGEPLSTIENCTLILANDEKLKGCIAINEFLDRTVVVKDLPWRKCNSRVNGDDWLYTDDSSLRLYLESVYGISGRGNIEDALNSVASQNSFHPVRDYLNSLSWDGKKRAENLFIDYLGAENNEYTKAVTKTWLTAAVARIMVPGCKFDYMLVLVGPQGVGKSYIGSKLGGAWFSDTFTTVQGKEGLEQLRGVWIIEIAELSALKKAESDAIKAFVSKQEDTYRGAYRKNTQTYKRQCVFLGTTNEHGFLRDTTGNRRFWPVTIPNGDFTEKLYTNLTDEIVDQIWAEAYFYFKRGDSLRLEPEMEELAIVEQTRYEEDNPRVGLVEEYLDRLLPEDWDDWPVTRRRDFIQGYLGDLEDIKLTKQRDTVCISEIAFELFNEPDLKAFEARDYHKIMRSVKGWTRKTAKSRTAYGRQPIYERVDKRQVKGENTE